MKGFSKGAATRKDTQVLQKLSNARDFSILTPFLMLLQEFLLKLD